MKQKEYSNNNCLNQLKQLSSIIYLLGYFIDHSFGSDFSYPTCSSSPTELIVSRLIEIFGVVVCGSVLSTFTYSADSY